MMFFPATSAAQLRLYLDESGTLGFGDEVFTMAMVLVSDLAKLEGCIARNKTTQAEIKASQMKTAQKLALAKTILEHNDLEIYLLTIDPAAANACERKLDKELLYDSMIAQAMAYYLERDELPRGGAYRLSLDMRGGIRESFEDMVCESIGNVLMHREEPLVSDLQIRYMDSKYSAGVQVADLFSNIYRTALSLSDSPCNEFLRKGYADGIIHLGFSFGLPELANQMAQIANDLRAHVEYNTANNIASTFRMMPTGMEEGAGAFGSNGEAQADKMVDAEVHAADGAGLDVADDDAAGDAPKANAEADDPADDTEETAGDNTEQPRALSRSARRRRSRAARKAADAKEATIHKAQANDLVDAVQVDGSANESPMDGAVDVAQAGASTAAAQADESAAGAAPVDGSAVMTRANSATAAAADASIESSAQVNTSTKSGQKQEANTVAEASALTSEADVEPATEPVVITARERRQKAAKKTAHSPAKSKQGQPLAGQKDDTAKSKAEAEAALTDNASSDMPKYANELTTAATDASMGKPQKATAADYQAAPVSDSAPASKADAAAKPKRTRTRSRSKAKEAPAEAKAEASQNGMEKNDPSQANAARADLARTNVAHVDSAQADASSKTDSTSAKPSSVKHTDRQAKATKTTASADSSSAETESVKATPATHDGGADNPAPAKPRTRRTRTRKTSGSDAQAQSE